MPVMFGPFTDAELTVRAHETSSSADWEESVKGDRIFEEPVPALQELYLLSDDNSFQRLEEIISSTDAVATPLIDTMMM